MRHHSTVLLQLLQVVDHKVANSNTTTEPCMNRGILCVDVWPMHRDIFINLATQIAKYNWTGYGPDVFKNSARFGYTFGTHHIAACRLLRSLYASARAAVTLRGNSVDRQCNGAGDICCNHAQRAWLLCASSSWIRQHRLLAIWKCKFN